MKLQLFLDTVSIVLGRTCPKCRRSTIRVSPRGLYFPVTVFPRYLSSRYCDTCDRRRLHVHVEIWRDSSDSGAS